jgi:hypothetical protein
VTSVGWDPSEILEPLHPRELREMVERIHAQGFTRSYAEEALRREVEGGSGSADDSALALRSGKQGRADVIRVADVQAERVDWLWPGWIARGKITVFDGDPGLGKSTVTLDLAARLSIGARMPCDDGSAPEPAATLLLSAEDGPADTIRPRLEAAGADLERIHILRGVPDGSAFRMPELPRDLDWIESVIIETGAALVVIDPLFAYLGDKINARVDHDVRRALALLAEMAARTHAAIVLVRHLNKAPGGPAIYRGGGSIGIIGAARSGMLLAADPGDATRRVIAQTKSNLGPPVPALALRLVPVSADKVARIAWEGPTNHQASDLLRIEDGAAHTEVEVATAWLREELSDGHPRESGEVKALAKDEGISARTLARACNLAAVETKREGFPARTTWTIRAGTHSRATPEEAACATGMVAQQRDSPNEATSSRSEGAGSLQSGHADGVAPLSESPAVDRDVQSASRPPDAGMYGPAAPA